MTLALRTKRIGVHSLATLAVVAVLSGLLLYVLSALSINASRTDVTAETLALGPDGATPALHLAAAEGRETPLGTVVVVHGFAASKEFMRDLGYSLARAGFEVFAVDVPGHGRSRLLLDVEGLPGWLSGVLADLARRGHLGEEPLFLVGHSLGTLVVTRVALEDPEVDADAVVALSPVFADITPTVPANYLALTGEGELPGVKETAFRALRRGTGLDEPELGTLYGSHADGTARLVAEVKGATHVSIVRAKAAVRRTIEWLYAAAGASDLDLPRIESIGAERGFGTVGAALLWLGAFYLGAGALGLLGYAPRRPQAVAVVEDARVAAGLPAKPPPPGKGPLEPPMTEGEKAAKETAARLFNAARMVPLLFAVAAVAAAVVPGYLGFADFLGQAAVDYLVVYLLVLPAVLFPLLLGAGRLFKTGPIVAPTARLGPVASALLGVGLFLLAYGLFGRHVTLSWTNLLAPSWRWGRVLLLAAAFWPFFALDEAVRGTVHDRTGFVWALFVSVMGKLIMVVTWYGGLFLPHPSQPLSVVMTSVVQLLIALDVASSVIYNEHGNWVAPSVFKALTFAWVTATVFPLLAGPLGL
ncbi:MAG TPA: hypothetical protein DGR79_02960 [Clostridiales bacterium]|nr:hypothetical protein [Clostridiales bacterium]